MSVCLDSQWEQFQKLFPNLPPIDQKQTIVIFSEKEGEIEDKIFQSAIPRFYFYSPSNEYIYQITGLAKGDRHISTCQAASDASIQQPIRFQTYIPLSEDPPRNITHLQPYDDIKGFLQEASDALADAIPVPPLINIILSYLPPYSSLRTRPLDAPPP